MGRIRFIVFIAVVFFATMAVYFHVRLNRLYKQQAARELGDSKTPGFREVFIADSLLTDPQAPKDIGNNKLAERLARDLRTHFETEFAEKLGFPTENDPRGIASPRVYCLTRGKYCMFLVYVPAFKDLTTDQQRAVAQALWPRAQELAAAHIPGHPTVGLGLRGHRLYGPILIGAKTGEPLLTREGGRYVFYPYFAGESTLQPNVPVAGSAGSVADKRPDRHVPETP